MQAHARSAYTQAAMGGEPTWLRLPSEVWPKHWHGKYKDPVVKMLKALYGHPNAGGYWERHCTQQLKSVGWVPVGPNWPSMFYHPARACTLMVYVDDFKMAGPPTAVATCWEDIQGVIELDPPEDVGRCLGCEHRVHEHVLSDGSSVRAIDWDMRDFIGQCVALYKELASLPSDRPLRRVATPYLAEPKHADDDASQGGALGKVALKVLMKTLYAARLARFDLLRPVGVLAKMVTRWNLQCDQRLHRLVCYMESTQSCVMMGYIGDPLGSLELRLYCDADFAGEKDSKSTSGIFEELAGPRSCFPLQARSTKQGSTAHSTPEAEIVALDEAVRTLGIPALDFWDKVRPPDSAAGPILVQCMEDNTSTIAIINTGKNPALRHVARTQKVDVGFLHEVFTEREDLASRLKLNYCPTKEQKADVFTKAFTDGASWAHACEMLNMSLPEDLKRHRGPKPEWYGAVAMRSAFDAREGHRDPQ